MARPKPFRSLRAVSRLKSSRPAAGVLPGKLMQSDTRHNEFECGISSYQASFLRRISLDFNHNYYDRARQTKILPGHSGSFMESA